MIVRNSRLANSRSSNNELISKCEDDRQNSPKNTSAFLKNAPSFDLFGRKIEAEKFVRDGWLPWIMPSSEMVDWNSQKVRGWPHRARLMKRPVAKEGQKTCRKVDQTLW
jgi:hypothetical protein